MRMIVSNNGKMHVQYQLTPELPLLLFSDVADPVAVRKLVLGVKDRAEGRVEPLRYQTTELGVYLLILVECLAGMTLVLTRRRWAWLWTLAFVSAFALLFALYSEAALWVKVLLALSLLAGLVFLLVTERRMEEV